ncbi:hypothetical protein LJC26_01020 [Desulfovibrio sp. OttesenSCG-928-O18]|nr:hypothetical protein [Desulfovibrio sp. OttesenSCG-928-O18]
MFLVFEHPIAVFLLLVTFVLLFAPQIAKVWMRYKKNKDPNYTPIPEDD